MKSCRLESLRHILTLLLLLLLPWLISGIALAAKQPNVGSVTFSPGGGVFSSPPSIKLTSDIGAPIRFTVDGSEPGPASPLYSGPIAVTDSALIRARTFPQDAPPSSMAAAAAYTVLDDDLATFSSNLPLIIVNSFGTNIVNSQKIAGALQIADGGTERTRLTSPAAFSSRCLVNLRGRASLRYPKGSFTVKLIDGDGEAAAASLLGLPADADWVLYAPYPDKTLIRDVVAYELYAAMGHWAPRTKLVEVFVHRSGTKLSQADYAGVYVLVERLKRGKHRVDLAKLKPGDNSEPRVTGGYIFKKDHVDQAGFQMGGEGGGPISQNTKAGFPTGPGGFPADPGGFQPPATVTRSSSSGSSSSRRPGRVITNHFGFASTFSPDSAGSTAFHDDDESSIKEEDSFKTGRTNEFYFVEPEPDEITAVQRGWLKNHLNQFEAVLYGPDFRDPVRGYQGFIDPDSFIDYHLITETTKNVDGFRFSVFFRKDRNGKIKADPIWDWNLSFGNANGKQGWLAEFWLWPQLDNKEYSWYRRLFEDPDFGQRYVDRWTQLRATTFSTAKILARIDELAAHLDESQRRNFEKWPILGRPIMPNYFAGATYEQEIAFVKKFISDRLDWIERQFLAPPKENTTDHGQLALSAPAGEIYFTLDGSDPRAAGGGVAAKATKFSAPIPRPAGAKVFARTRQQDRWSGAYSSPR